MNTQTIIILVLAVIIGIILIKVISKIIFKVLILILLAGVICYFLFFKNGGIFSTGDTAISIYNLQETYCVEKLDTVKCECIINPILLELEAQYKPEELAVLQEDPIKMTNILLKIVNENRSSIKDCLAEHNAEYSLDDFIKDIRTFRRDK